MKCIGLNNVCRYKFSFLKYINTNFEGVKTFKVRESVIWRNRSIENQIKQKFRHPQVELSLLFSDRFNNFKSKSILFSCTSKYKKSLNPFILYKGQYIHTSIFVGIVEDRDILYNSESIILDSSERSLEINKQIESRLCESPENIEILKLKASEHYINFHSCMQKIGSSHCYETLFIKCSNNYDLIVQLYNSLNGG